MRARAEDIYLCGLLLQRLEQEKRELKLPIHVAFKLAKIVREANELEKARIELVRRYGKPSSDGLSVPPEALSKFQAEWIKLLNEELELPFDPLSLSDLENVNLSIGELAVLLPFCKQDADSGQSTTVS